MTSGSLLLSRREALTGFALFLLIGAVGAVFGPVLPSYRSTFGLSAAAGGLLLSGHYAGSVAGILSPNVLRGRLASPRLFAPASAFLFALGCGVIGAAPHPAIAELGVLIEGAGWGALVICMNTLFAAGFGRRSPAMLTLLNAIYGIGAILGPAAAGIIFGGQFRGPLLSAAALALLLSPLAVGLPDTPLQRAPEGREEPSGNGRYAVLLGGFIACFFLFGGLEGGIGAWEATHLVAAGYSAAAAATISSLFWVTYTGSRLAAAPLSLRIPPQRIVPAMVMAVVALMLFTWVAGAPAIAYTITGAAVGPIFPLALVWSGRVLAVSGRAASIVIASDLFGGVVLSAALGNVVTLAGAGALPLAFAAIAGASLLIAGGLGWLAGW